MSKKQQKKKQEQPVQQPIGTVFPEVKEDGHQSRKCFVFSAKMDRKQVEHWIRLMTGLSEEELTELKVRLAIEWLSRYLNFEGNAFDVEADVYRLLAKEYVYGWWMNEYADYDKRIVEELKEFYEDWSGLALEVISTTLNDRNRTLNDRTLNDWSTVHMDGLAGVKDEVRRKYIALHWERMKEGSKEYIKLEDSYSLIFKFIK